MVQNKTWILILLLGLALSCSREKENNSAFVKLPPTAFESALNETKELLLLVKSNTLIMDSSVVEVFVVSQGLEPENNNFRSETTFKNIYLKKIFKCNNGIVNTVHFDFYYDSLNSNLTQDSRAILELLKTTLGQQTSSDSTNSMKIITWNLTNNVLDYELFNNGFTFTIRKKEKMISPVVSEKKLPLQLELAGLLVSHIHNDSLRLESSTILSVQNLFNVAFKKKSSALTFSGTYNENILLSGSFLFNGDKLSGTYFDYVYLDTISQSFVSDAIIVKSIITELYGAPSDVATVSLSTSYKWGSPPIILDIYGNGFSIILEKEGL
jgi:hypothetical protein